MNVKSGMAACAAACVLTLSGHADLINAGFETGDFTGWSTFGQGWRTSGGGDANSGLFGVVNDVQDTDADNFRGIFQELPVVGGATYDFGVQIRAVNVESSESWLEVQWLDSSGGIINQLQSTHVTADQPFTWISIEDALAPVNAVTASVRGIVFMSATPAVNTDFHIFDDFSVVPEPGSAGLLILGGLLATRRLSRRRES